MSVTRRRLLRIGLASPVFVLSRTSRAAEFPLKFGINTPETHPASVRANEAASRIREQSSGRVQVSVFPNSALGSDADMLAQLRSGGLELFAAPSLTLSTLVAASGIPSVGFALKTYEQVWAAMDGELGAYIRGEISKTRVVPMSRVWDNGFRQITSGTHPINGPEDLVNFKIRVPVTALLTSLFRSLGAAPTSISFAEFYSALQTHIADGQENPLALIDTGKLYEVHKYCAIINHCWSGYWIIANRTAFQSLPADLRDVVARNFDRSALDERADLAQLDRTLEDQLAKSGMVFNRPSPAPFRAALEKAGFYAQWKKTYGERAWATLEKYAS